MKGCVVNFFYSSYLLVWIIIGIVVITIDFAICSISVLDEHSITGIALYLSLFAYLIERLRYASSKKQSVLLAYLFLIFWLILAALSVS